MILMKEYVSLTSAAMKMGKRHFYSDHSKSFIVRVSSDSEFMTFLENYKLRMIPECKITNRRLVGIGCQWLPMATNKLLIDYQCTLIALTKFLPLMIGAN